MNYIYKFFVSCCFFSYMLGAANKKSQVDPAVVEYVMDIISKKVKLLEKEGKTLNIDNLSITYMSSEYNNQINAQVIKYGKDLVNLQLSWSLVEIIKLILDPINEQIILYSPFSGRYKVEMIVPKDRVHAMICFVIEHELGHIFYKDHVRSYFPWVFAKIMARCIGVGSASYFLYKSFFSNESYSFIKKSTAAAILLKGLYDNSSVQTQYEMTNFTHIPAYKWAEQQADDFVSDNIETLKGGVLFHTFDYYYHVYVSSHTKWIQMLAYLRRMDPVQFIKTYPNFTHRLIEPWTPCKAVHPAPCQRAQRFKERIEQLKNVGYIENRSDTATITVYKNDQIIEQVVV